MSPRTGTLESRIATWCRIGLWMGAGILLLGCSTPPDGDNTRSTVLHEESGGQLQANFAAMADNAAISDMSVADIHFVPHSAELSGTGVARLSRLSPILNTYGGTLRYETFETDPDMINRRLAYVHEFLVDTGCAMDRVEIKAMLSGGRGMRADEAIVIATPTPAIQSARASSGSPSTTSSGGASGGGGGAQ